VPGGERTDVAVVAGMPGDVLFVFSKRVDRQGVFNQAALRNLLPKPLH
jgi:hypothetical protein